MPDRTTTGRPAWRATLTSRGFVVHYLQMLAAMLVGMGVGLVLESVAGGHDSDAVPAEVHALLMATWMTVGMTAWMVWRRHRWPSILEMAAAMYLAFAVLFPAYWLGVLSGPGVLVVGHVVMLPAMALAMLHRREEYVGG